VCYINETAGDALQTPSSPRRHTSPSDLVDNDGGTARLDRDDLLLLAGSHRVRCREDLIELLERPAVGLNTEEVPESSLDAVPGDEHVDVVRADVTNGDGAGEQVTRMKLAALANSAGT